MQKRLRWNQNVFSLASFRTLRGRHPWAAVHGLDTCAMLQPVRHCYWETVIWTVLHPCTHMQHVHQLLHFLHTHTHTHTRTRTRTRTRTQSPTVTLFVNCEYYFEKADETDDPLAAQGEKPPRMTTLRAPIFPPPLYAKVVADPTFQQLHTQFGYLAPWCTRCYEHIDFSQNFPLNQFCDLHLNVLFCMTIFSNYNFMHEFASDQSAKPHIITVMHIRA